MPCLGSAEFGASSLYASCHAGDECGTNGLPLTPYSICILGRFQQLLRVDHPRLCKYLDMYRGKHEHIIVVAEHYQLNLAVKMKNGAVFSNDDLITLAFDVLSGLVHMNSVNLVHRNLSLDNILFDSTGRAKLSKYGLYYMTNQGVDVSFPIGFPKYMAPEVICEGARKACATQVINRDGQLLSGTAGSLTVLPCSPKVDVWSLGIILLEVILGRPFWEHLTLGETFKKILDIIRSGRHPFEVLTEEHGDIKMTIQNLPADLLEFIKSCLTLTPSKRRLPVDLLNSSIFTDLCNRLRKPRSTEIDMFSTRVRSVDLELSPESGDHEDEKLDENEDLLSKRSIEEVYYLWKLAGGDLEGTLKKAGHIPRHPPITKLACFVVDDGELFGGQRDVTALLDSSVILLSQDQLRQKLKDVDTAAYFPLLEDEGSINTIDGLPNSTSSVDLQECTRLPLVIREKDVTYQFHRIILFERLLNGYPFKRVHILKEARVDIPPMYRPLLWAAILDVQGDVQGRYKAIDKESPIPTDRQIEVDIPRCHQYNELLSSPTGHIKFKRLLKAWVVSHPEYVYWQGLDSMCAPFLCLNFSDEATAFACLTAFIPKYLHNFFLKDNACVIQEYLAVFSHLIAFHDPQLSNHLDEIGFIPDLYSIPWFLTMYAHVFPLHKIFHLWDTLLLGNSSFPLCIGVAILQQLRDQLLSYGFNECILLFSDMPEIDIERCVQDSIKIFCSTPKSATYRQHALSVGQPSVKQSMFNRPQLSPKSSVHSYYSQDCHELPKSELSMDPISLDELKSEKFPRISAEDLIELSEIHGPSPGLSPAKKGKAAKPSLFIIDVRSVEEFKRGSVSGSVNLPYTSVVAANGDFNLSSAMLQLLNNHRGQIKVVVGSSRGKHASHFAESLICLGYSRVCVLHKGVDVLRTARILTVPTPEL